MENVTKIKLKSAKHKIGVGYREGEKKKHNNLPLFTKPWRNAEW